MAKYTIQEFQYLLKFHNLSSAPVCSDGNFYGFITEDLKYTHQHCLSYFADKEYAIGLAIDNLDHFIEQVKKLRSKDVVTVKVIYHNEHNVWDYADSDGVVRHHVYPKMVDDTEFSDFTGTYDQVFEKLQRGNNSLRYCNGYYAEFEDKEVKALYRTWQVVLPESRSFDMYYQGGIVD